MVAVRWAVSRQVVNDGGPAGSASIGEGVVNGGSLAGSVSAGEGVVNGGGPAGEKVAIEVVPKDKVSGCLGCLGTALNPRAAFPLGL